MALNGNLSNFRLGDILQTIWQNQTWGVLRVQSGSRRRDLVVSPHGVAVLDLCHVARSRIEDRLFHRGVLTRERLEWIRSKESARKPLQELLREIPGFDPASLTPCFEAEADEILDNLLAWTEGTFELVEGEPPGQIAEAPPRDASSLLLEAARRQDEKMLLGDRFPDPRERFVALQPETNAGAAAAEPANISEKLLPYLDGRSSLRAVADRTIGDFFTTAKLVCELEAAGRARRLDWEELLALGEEFGRQELRGDAIDVFELAVHCRPVRDDQSLLDLAIRRTASGDHEGAAATLCSASKRFRATGEFARATVCLRQAVKLSPRDVQIHREYFENLFDDETAENSERYTACRDYLVVCVDRGEKSFPDERFNSILPFVPQDTVEESRFARAAGLLGRKQVAEQFLVRAAGRCGRKRSAEALSLYREALQFNPDSREALKGVARLTRSKNFKILRAGALSAAVLVVAALAGVPVHSRLLENSLEQQLTGARLLIESADFARAQKIIDEVESATQKPTVLETCQRLRGDIARLSDARRSLEESETDEWIRSQFASAATAIESRDYYTAVELYDAILRKRADDSRVGLVKYRIEIITLRLAQEARRIAELGKSVQQSAKGSLGTEPPSLKELQALCNDGRRDQLGRIPSKLEGSPIAKLMSKTLCNDLLGGVSKSLLSIAEGQKIVRSFMQRLADARELRELEPVLLDARAAEHDGDPRSALKSFEELQKRYRGVALKPYFEERVRHWTAVVHELDAIGRAVQDGNAALVETHKSNLEKLAPGIRSDAVRVALELTTTPAGAEVFINDQSIGTTPVRLSKTIDSGACVELRLKGFETEKYISDGGLRKALHWYLAPAPAWTSQLPGAPASAGIVTGERWIVADRAGHAVLLDRNSGQRTDASSASTLEGAAGSVCVAGDLGWLLTREGTLQAFSLVDGSLRETQTIGHRVRQGIVQIGEVALWVTENDELEGFDLAARRLLPAVRLPRRVTTPPVAKDGTVAVGSAEGSVAICRIGGGPDRAISMQSAEIRIPVDFLEFLDRGHLVAVSGEKAVRVDVATLTASPPVAFAGPATGAPMVAEAVWLPAGNRLLKLDCKSLATLDTIRWSQESTIRNAASVGGFVAVARDDDGLLLDYSGQIIWKSPLCRRSQIMDLGSGRVGFVGEKGSIYVFSLKQ
jgi:tetratricopeptide (TPR) repeat protein